jgi:hypothetical protein
MPQRAKVSRCWAFQQQDRFRLAETKRMRFAIEKAGIEQPFDVTGRHRTVGDALAARGNFDHRLEPEQAARAGANDFGVDLATAQRRNNRPIDIVRADHERGGVARNEDTRSRHDRRVRSMSVSRRY